VVRPALRREPAFVGRQAELRVLADLVDGGEDRVGYVHGIAGIGKSVLLCRSLRLARDAGVGVVALDCRSVEPTARGVLRATGGFPDVVELGTHLASLPSSAVLALDHCEFLQPIDDWLREELAAALPGGVTLLLAGRTAPLGGGVPQPADRAVGRGGLASAAGSSRCAGG
jgi:hypothetical protein